MSDVLQHPRTIAEEHQTLELLADISDLHVDARRRLMSIFYSYRERMGQLEEEIRELRQRVARSGR